jgi:hypothetical protein
VVTKIRILPTLLQSSIYKSVCRIKLTFPGKENKGPQAKGGYQGFLELNLDNTLSHTEIPFEMILDRSMTMRVN